MNDVHTRLGARVREARTRRGWTQEALGERAGLSYKFIGEIERGTGNPTVESVNQIADALSVDVGELFQREETEREYPAMQPSDVAVVRDVRQSLVPLEEMMRRLHAAMRPRPRRRGRKR